MISTILVPVDPASISKAALNLATESAKAYGASVKLVAVIPLVGSGRTSELAPEGGDDITTGVGYRRHARAEPIHDTSAQPGHAGALVEEQLQALARELEQEVESVEVIVASGDAADNIVEMAHREGIGLIVMATHGRTGIARGFLGSVTDAVIRNAETPVLVVRG